MKREAEFVIRPYAPAADLLWLLRLLTEVEAADQDGEDVTEAFLAVVDILEGPGVAPEHRHMELQRPLVQNAMRWIRDRGQGPVELHSYGDSEQTAGIYYDLGFRLDWQLIEYRLDLNPS